MRAVHIRTVGSNGGPEALETIEDFPVPECGHDQVLIKVAAFGINRPDVLQRKGLYPPPPGHSELPGLEVSGTVACIGPGVSSFQVGEEVCALTNGGAYAEYCAVPSYQCLPIPPTLNIVQAALVPETFFTVYHVMFQHTNIFGERTFDRPGSSVLIHGGSSGIGTTAIQLAKVLGKARQVFTTAGSDEKCEFLKRLGADHTINYKKFDFAESIMAATQGEGVDYVLDMVAGDYVDKNLKILRMQGRLSVIGSLGSPEVKANFRHLMRNRLTIGGSTIRAQTKNVKSSIAQALRNQVWPLFERGSVKVVEHPERFTMDSVVEAHRLMESSVHIGKIGVVVDTERRS
eukprot:CAMPEP_0203754044 /NCGR_PEP_ID=MMETSP0098-20131031/7705_1 /ASSEMBLY_ACC=CAM_ASM_000208 /TAXON_ID=96639 /ORGANISM=" , Strain NY0313808BC1" /LENGTH=345 /DNA_ID=CAMNT_0050644895 /DNA_START=728 /DNA_END=1765 /DNA_ORIENTATION=+